MEHCACDNAGMFCLVVSDKGAVYFGGLNKKGEGGEPGSQAVDPNTPHLLYIYMYIHVPVYTVTSTCIWYMRLSR